MEHCGTIGWDKLMNDDATIHQLRRPFTHADDEATWEFWVSYDIILYHIISIYLYIIIYI